VKHRNDLMLLRIAQADAYAMAREYVKTVDFPEHVAECLKLERYLAHPSYHKLPAGTYTDDTQMSIAVAEVLTIAASDGPKAPQGLLDATTWAAAWFYSFKRDPRDGYSRHFQAILEAATTPDHLRQLMVPNSDKNGAAMRSVPLGVIRRPQELVQVAGLQASTTHATWGGINSSIAVALMSHFALYDRRSFTSMLGWGIHHCPAFEHFREPWVGPVQADSDDGKGLGVGMNTAWAVHTLLTTETSLMGILKQTIKWGGDTDSVASIAWGIASARYPNEALPEFLERDLEAKTTSTYGPTYLRQLGKQLMETYDVHPDGPQRVP
jgi:ADP-ribosylglycohydrolase